MAFSGDFEVPNDDDDRDVRQAAERDADVVRRLFAAVEQRDLEECLACYHPEVEIHEAEVLPYGGVWRGHDGAARHAAAFLEAWGAFQGPTEVRLDPRIWGDGAGTVSVLFRHRAVEPVHGERLDAAEVGIYEVRDGRIVRSQMFHADSAAVARFLHDAQTVTPASGQR